MNDCLTIASRIKPYKVGSSRIGLTKVNQRKESERTVFSSQSLNPEVAPLSLLVFFSLKIDNYHIA